MFSSSVYLWISNGFTFSATNVDFFTVQNYFFNMSLHPRFVSSCATLFHELAILLKIMLKICRMTCVLNKFCLFLHKIAEYSTLLRKVSTKRGDGAEKVN